MSANHYIPFTLDKIGVFQNMLLNDLLRHINHLGEPTYQFWARDIKPYYEPLINQVFTDPEDQKLLKKSRRTFVLFKYWGMNKVTNLEEARASIPLCRYCHERLALPRSAEPKNEGDEWITVCRCPQCTKKYVYSQTAQSCKKLYGVENISSSEETKKWRSKHMTELYQTERGKEANEKRVQTISSIYGEGITNVSQLATVQHSKETSFLAHYGVTNIFKRIDLMKQYWLNTLGVEYVCWNSDVHIEAMYNSLQTRMKKYGESIDLGGKEFLLMHSSEGVLLKHLCEVFNPNYITANRYIFEKRIDNKSRLTIVDVAVNDQIFIELKSSLWYYDREYLDEKLNIISGQLNSNQRYIVYLKLGEHNEHALVLKPDGTFAVNTSDNDLTRCREYFGGIVDMEGHKSYNIQDMDRSLTRGISKLIHDKEVFNKSFLESQLSYKSAV